MRIHLYYIGKPRDRSANAMAEEYIKRSGRFGRCEMREILPSRFDPWQKHPSARKVLLEAAGKPLNSTGFALLLAKAEREGCDLVFLVGGAEGPPPGWDKRADMLLSLSPMTYPHELARVMLAEQIYRAFTTLRGHPYPK